MGVCAKIILKKTPKRKILAHILILYKFCPVSLGCLFYIACGRGPGPIIAASKSIFVGLLNIFPSFL
uniref:Candidate secreted effector n=1 Tax=Meloidogyne incognita TaxID=6306 RepID=A0A914LV30_MELIC